MRNLPSQTETINENHNEQCYVSKSSLLSTPCHLSSCLNVSYPNVHFYVHSSTSQAIVTSQYASWGHQDEVVPVTWLLIATYSTLINTRLITYQSWSTPLTREQSMKLHVFIAVPFLRHSATGRTPSPLREWPWAVSKWKTSGTSARGLWASQPFIVTITPSSGGKQPPALR